MKIEVTSSQMTDKACKTSVGLNCQIQKGLLRVYKNSLFFPLVCKLNFISHYLLKQTNNNNKLEIREYMKALATLEAVGYSPTPNLP